MALMEHAVPEFTFTGVRTESPTAPSCGRPWRRAASVSWQSLRTRRGCPLSRDARPFRAGRYASVGGAEYRAMFSDNSPAVVLVTWNQPHERDGFSWEADRFGGCWSRTIARDEAEELFEVRTWGLYHGVYPVRVLEWMTRETLHVTLGGPDAPARYDRLEGPARDSVVEGPDGFRQLEPGGLKHGVIRVDELADIVEERRELPRAVPSRDDRRREWSASR